MKIRIVSLTDVGKERDNNEDALAFCADLYEQRWNKTDKGYISLGKLGAITVVADGMGGAEAGEVASGLAIQVMKKRLQPQAINELVSRPLSYIHEYLISCISEANETILEYEQKNPDVIGMGTTIVVAWIIGGKIHVAWCGDSRCYVYNPKKGLNTLTKDHSYVQELIDSKKISEEEAFTHPDSNIITRCLGDADTSSKPDVLTEELIEGDVVLLCSDGLCGYCRDKQIEKVLYKYYKDVDKCCESLVSLALNSGGYDNITVSLVSTVSDCQNAPSIPMMTRLKNMFK